MEFNIRSASLQEANSRNKLLIFSCVGLVGVVLILAIVLTAQSKIVVLQTPGMPNDTVIEKTTMDKGAQRAVLQAVTSNLAQINPSNFEYQKSFLQSFLAPDVYTKVSLKIDARVKDLIDQRELGSNYFVFKRYLYDEKLNKHFVQGDVHTVNAAKDTTEPYVFEYSMAVNNYRPIITDVAVYKGEELHDTKHFERKSRS